MFFCILFHFTWPKIENVYVPKLQQLWTWNCRYLLWGLLRTNTESFKSILYYHYNGTGVLWLFVVTWLAQHISNVRTIVWWGILTSKFQKHGFGITVDPNGPLSWSTFWLVFESPNPELPARWQCPFTIWEIPNCLVLIKSVYNMQKYNHWPSYNLKYEVHFWEKRELKKAVWW